MSQPPLPLPRKIVNDVEKKIEEVISIGTEIRSILGSRNDEEQFGEKWEVNAAVESLNILSGKWTVEIMSALYITGDKRFNDLKHLLAGISSRTLSDKLTRILPPSIISDSFMLPGFSQFSLVIVKSCATSQSLLVK